MRNQLKIRVLGALEGRGWLNAPIVSALARFRPVRSVYTYMDRLRRWGLVRRRKLLGRMVLYSITRRGRERLAWLREHSQ